MDKVEVRKRFEQEWQPWTRMLADADPEVTRTPGVCGFWTLHDVVGHVQTYARWTFAQARAAFTLTEPADAEWQGERADWPPGDHSALDARNEAIRVSGLSLSWQQLRDESEWIRTRVLGWIEDVPEDLLDEPVGWVHFWEPRFQAADGGRPLPLMVRRLSEVPNADRPLPVGQLVCPNGHDNHVGEHLGQITTWLADRGRQ